MRIKLACLTALALLALPAIAQQTPASMATAYDALADTILAVRHAELGFVAAMLDGHRHAAEVLMARGDHQRAAAEMALFANEGDNAVGGVRKRLLDGGHHFNAAGEDAGIFEEGYVVVTRKAKETLLAASSALRQATTQEARDAAWQSFKATAEKLLAAAHATLKAD